MENEMIERVAKAIACEMEGDWERIPERSAGEASREDLRIAACLAIEAMRVPTEAMLRAMKTGPHNAYDRFEVAETYGTIGVDPDKCAEIYTAMIDAILKSE